MTLIITLIDDICKILLSKTFEIIPPRVRDNMDEKILSFQRGFKLRRGYSYGGNSFKCFRIKPKKKRSRKLWVKPWL